MASVSCAQCIQFFSPHQVFAGFPNRGIQLRARDIAPKCCSNQDARLSAELKTETMKHKVSGLQRMEAMKKSKTLLFIALCEHSGVSEEAMRNKWACLKEQEKIDFLRSFVDEWGAPWHPLSLKSVRLLVNEHVSERNPPPSQPSPLLSFSALQRLKDFLSIGNS